MPTSDRRPRWRAAAALLFLAAVAVVACGAAGDCLRFSDCDQGLTCAYGHCVLPPPPESDAAPLEDGGAPSTTTPVDAGSPTVISPTASDAGSDASIQTGTETGTEASPE